MLRTLYILFLIFFAITNFAFMYMVYGFIGLIIVAILMLCIVSFEVLDHKRKGE